MRAFRSRRAVVKIRQAIVVEGKYDQNTLSQIVDATIFQTRGFGVMHDKLPILGYRFGDFAYITDMKTIEDEEFERLRGVKTLVVNALRWEKWHHSHMTVEEAMAFAQRVGAERTYFTHMGHGIGLHDEANARLPKNMWFAYDGEIIEV